MQHEDERSGSLPTDQEQILVWKCENLGAPEFVSVVGLGCNNFGLYQDAAQAVAVVRKALDVGINFLDMAGEHGGGLEESLVAEQLGPRRKDVIIATKYGQAELLALKDG